jgi:hypothetical protein
VKAAEYGIGALVFGFGGIESVRAQRRLYDKTRDTCGTDKHVATIVNHHLSALCPTIILDDRMQAKEIGARGQRFFAESISQWGRPGSPEPTDHTEHLDNIAHMHAQRDVFLREVEKNPELKAQLTVAAGTFNVDHAYGNVADAIAYVEGLEDAGADEVMCMIQMGTIPQEVCLETIRQWGTKVIPHFRKKRRAA